MDKNLTVLIPLKGRDLYTKRIAEYLNFIECPYKILFADGGDSLEIEKYLRDKNNLPNLNYDYIRYPHDATLSHFHTKMALATAQISTPFTLLHDNDDFFITETIKKCVDFLIENSDYNSARGKKFDFHLSQGICGQINITHEMYTKYTDSLIGEKVHERLSKQCSAFHANYHNVRRTKNVCTTYKLIEIIDFLNYRFAHQTESFLNVVWGKSNRKIDGVHLMHQGSSPSVGSSHFPPQDEWIVADYWKNDFVGMMDLFGSLINYYDGIPLEASRNMFADAYIDKLPDLKDLLSGRIEECKREKINKNRIQNLQQCIHEHSNQKETTVHEQTNFKFSSHEEINVLQFFLNNRK